MTCNFLKQRTNKNWRFCVFVENVGTNRKLWLTKKNENFGGKKMFRSEFRKKCYDLISSKVMVKVKSSPYLFVFSVGLRLKQEVVSWRPKKRGRVAPSRFWFQFEARFRCRRFSAWWESTTRPRRFTMRSDFLSAFNISLSWIFFQFFKQTLIAQLPLLICQQSDLSRLQS